MEKEEYYHALKHLILPAPNNKSYSILIEKLYSMNFIPKIERDENRASDGVFLRENFGYNSDDPCSVLEMMIALAGRFDGNSGFDIDHARSNFWILIDNLSVDRFDDSYCLKNVYGRIIIETAIQRMMDRTYQFNGYGGLFPLKHAKNDQRKIEIWDQMQEWLIENYGV